MQEAKKNKNCEESKGERYLTGFEAAEMLGWKEQTLRAHRAQGGFIRYVRLGSGSRGRIRYRLSDIEAYLAAQTFTSTTAETVAKCSEAVSSD